MGGSVEGDLMLIPGPLGFNWYGRRRWLVPRLETGELASYSPPTAHRARLWLRFAPRISDNIFIKLFTHGAQERNSQELLGGALDLTLQYFKAECARQGIQCYFVSAYQMWKVIEAVREQREPLSALEQTNGKPENPSAPTAIVGRQELLQ